MVQHTPGPWTAANRWGNFGDHNRSEPDAPTGQGSRFAYAIRDAEGLVVAHCTNPLITMSAERSEANARLMAAAPELLQGCNAALAYLADPPSVYPENRQAAIEIIRAALAKAEGRA